VLDGREHVWAICVEVPMQGEPIPAHEAPAYALTLNGHPSGGLFLHPHGGAPLILDEEAVEVSRSVATTGVDSIEPPGVSTGEVVDLQPVVVANAERMADMAHSHIACDPRVSFEALSGDLEAMVAKRNSARAEFLGLLPRVD
jgi:hypothetical protein